MPEPGSVSSVLLPEGNQAARRLLDSVPQVASAIFGAVSSSILLLDKEREDLVFCSVSNPAESGLVGSRFPMELGIAGWVLNSGEPIIVDDVSHLEVFARDVAEATGHLPTAIMAAPLVHDGESLGVIEVIDPAPQSRSSLNELELLSLFAGQAALSLHALLHRGRAGGEGALDGADLASSLNPQERMAGLRLVRALEELLAR